MYVSGEKLQELTDLTIIFDDQRHPDLWQAQIPNTTCAYVVLKVGEQLPLEVYQARSIFVYTHALDMFFQRVFPLLKSPFILMSHNSDWGINDAQYDAYLNDPKLIRWFAQNVNYKHEKLIPIPIGIANSQWEHGDFSVIEDVIKEDNSLTRPVYNNFNPTTSPENRYHVARALHLNNIPIDQPTYNKDFLRKLSKSVCCICPFGAGYDSHRVWEAQYLGSIPVVPRCVAFESFELPFIHIDNWDDVTYDYLYKSVERIKRGEYNKSQLSITYWRDVINSYIDFQV